MFEHRGKVCRWVQTDSDPWRTWEVKANTPFTALFSRTDRAPFLLNSLTASPLSQHTAVLAILVYGSFVLFSICPIFCLICFLSFDICTEILHHFPSDLCIFSDLRSFACVPGRFLKIITLQTICRFDFDQTKRPKTNSGTTQVAFRFEPFLSKPVSHTYSSRLLEVVQLKVSYSSPCSKPSWGFFLFSSLFFKNHLNVNKTVYHMCRKIRF